nr:element excision factor XisI family protein [Spirulina subsalsa]
MFHARLVDQKVLIEEDNFEEGLTHQLIVAGINAEDIVFDSQNLLSLS